MARNVLTALAAHGIQATEQQGGTLLRLTRGTHTAILQLRVCRRLTSGTAGTLRASARQADPPLLILTEYVNPTLAERLRHWGLYFADTAGNVWIDTPELLILVTGRKPPPRRIDERPMRLFQPAGLRLLFLLLCEPDRARLPTRRLAEQAGVANGTVGWILKDLTQLGYLHVLRGRRRFIPDKALLTRWLQGYEAQLRPKLIRARFWTDQPDWWKSTTFDGERFALGGEAAAERLTDYLRGVTTTIYQNPDLTQAAEQLRQLDRWKQQARMRPEVGWNVELLDRFWPLDLTPEQPGLVPVTLIYTDLMLSGDDRCLETAERLYDRYLAGRFERV